MGVASGQTDGAALILLAAAGVAAAHGFARHVRGLRSQPAVFSPPRQTRQDTPPARLRAAPEEPWVGGVLPLREAHERVCRAHDVQTAKLEVAITELARVQREYTVELEALEKGYATELEGLEQENVELRYELKCAREDAGNERERHAETQRRLEALAAERENSRRHFVGLATQQNQTVSDNLKAPSTLDQVKIDLARTKSVSVDDALAALKQELHELDAAIASSQAEGSAPVESLERRRAALAGGVYRLHVLARGGVPPSPPRVDYTDEVAREHEQVHLLEKWPPELTGELEWPPDNPPRS